VEFAKSAAGSAAAAAGAGGTGHLVEEMIWSLLADGADQRLVGNQYKLQLQDMMQAKMDHLDSVHRRESEAAEATTRQRSQSASSSGKISESLRLSGRDRSGSAATLSSAGSGLRVSFKRSMSDLGAGEADDAAGEGGDTTGGATAGGGAISEVIDGANAHVGYLWKRGAVNRTWKQRWCELKAPAQGAGSGLLLYYTGVNDVTPRGVINLAECSYEPDWSAANRKHTFKLVGKHRDGTKTAYLLAAANAEEKTQWLELMQR
jgi:hypothetical protein